MEPWFSFLSPLPEPSLNPKPETCGAVFLDDYIFGGAGSVLRSPEESLTSLGKASAGIGREDHCT